MVSFRIPIWPIFGNLQILKSGKTWHEQRLPIVEDRRREKNRI